VRFRFRYLARGQPEAATGTGEVVEVANQVQPGFGVVDAAASRIWIAVGPLRVMWSHRGPGSGWIYWVPEESRVMPVAEIEFDTLDLRRFVR
jgi:hypothetical protein